VVVDLRGNGGLVEHGQVPGEEVDEYEVCVWCCFFDGVEDEVGDLVAYSRLSARADYDGDGERGHFVMSGVEVEMEYHLELEIGLCDVLRSLSSPAREVI